MTDEQIVEAAKKAEQKTEFGELVYSKVSQGVNSAYGIGFLEGAEWAREQMMKDALHGWLDEDNEPPYDLNVVCEEKIPFGKFKHCDKVRIIIVKEDEK